MRDHFGAFFNRQYISVRTGEVRTLASSSKVSLGASVSNVRDPGNYFRAPWIVEGLSGGNPVLVNAHSLAHGVGCDKWALDDSVTD